MPGKHPTFFQKRNFKELNDCGWTVLSFDGKDDSLLRMAAALGIPIACQSNYPIIQQLTPHQNSSKSGISFSKVFGTGGFPLHTDLAHWPLPARYVLLADVGISHSRPTFVLSQSNFLAKFDEADIGHSVWKVPGPMGSFLCSMNFKALNRNWLRFDPLCMQPQNEAARAIINANKSIQYSPIQVDWSQNLVLVIDNWLMLHGRGGSSVNDTNHRVLKRILIENKERS